MGSHTPRSRWSPITEMPRKDKIIIATTLVVAVFALIGLGLWGASRAVPRAVAQPAPVVDTETSDPSAVKHGLAVPDGPAPDSPPFGIDAQAMLVEIRSHGIQLADADSQKLLMIGDAAVSRNQPDLQADDPGIMRDVVSWFPQFTDQNRKDATRCLAEYAERVIARNHNTVPPDSDHGQKTGEN